MFVPGIILSILVAIQCCNAVTTVLGQIIPVESTRDIGTTYTLSINAEEETMTLSMFGPSTVWMGVIMGAEEMNGCAYVYYLDDNGDWVFTERYLEGEVDAGELIAIIDPDNYEETTQNGSTSIIFTRPWVGPYETSFTLRSNDTIFEYGFARGVDGRLAYHGPTLRSHSQYVLEHGNVTIGGTCCGCVTGSDEPGCPQDPECEDQVCNTFNSLCCTNQWREQCGEAAAEICVEEGGVLPSCCGCLTTSRPGNQGNQGNNGNNVIIGCEDDSECENEICGIDSFCCGGDENGSGFWDSVCVTQATAICLGEEVPPCCACTVINNNGGCPQDEECQRAICAVDSFCCGERDGSGFWDSVCINQASVVCDGGAFPTIPPQFNTGNGGNEGGGYQYYFNE